MTGASVFLLRATSAAAAAAFVLISGWQLATVFAELSERDADLWAQRVGQGLKAGSGRYTEALETVRHQYPALVAAELRSVDGHDLAHVPAAITRFQWGLAAPVLRGTRYLYWFLISTSVTVDLELDGGPVRSAKLRVLRGYTAVALLGTAALWQFLLAAIGALALGLIWLRQRRLSQGETLPAQAPPLAYNWLALVHVPLLEAGPDGIIRRLNSAAAEALGSDPADIVGRPLQAVLRVRGAGGARIDVLSVGRHVGQWRDPQGELCEIAVTVSLSPQTDPAGVIVEWQPLPTAPEAESPRRDPAFEQLATAALVTDKLGRIQRINRAAARMFGYSPEELQSLNIGKLMPVPFLNQSNVTLASYVDAVPSRLPQVVGWRKDATHFRVELGVAPLPGERGYVIHVVDADHAQLNAPAHQRWGMLTYAAGDPALIVDAHNLYVLDANPAAGQRLDVDAGQWRRMTLRHFVAPDRVASLDAELEALRQSSRPVAVIDGGCITTSGTVCPGRWRISYCRDIDPPAYLAVFVA